MAINKPRRHFLHYLSLASAAMLFPQKAMAASKQYDGPLWIFVHAGGGWDPTSFCDPKGYLGETDSEGNIVPEANPMNRPYAASSIRTVAGTNTRYAPINSTNSSSTYDYSQFFERYGKKLLVINGIDTQTNGHDQGTRFTFSGKLGEGHPSLAALIAAVHMPDSPLGFITFGGYDFTAGLVSASRIGSAEIIERLAFPNKQRFNNNSYHHPVAYHEVERAKLFRRQRQLGTSSLANKRESIETFYATNSASGELRELMQYMPTNQNGDSRMLREARFAMATYKAGLTTSVSIRSGGFDTHGNHDQTHLRNLGNLLSGVDDILQEASAQGLANDIILVVGSDFGRTPRYNGGNGKDHWPVGSMLLYGKGIRGGRTIGKTNYEHEIEPQNGVTINNAHIHLALRKLAGVDKHPLSTQTFTIDESNINLLT